MHRFRFDDNAGLCAPPAVHDELRRVNDLQGPTCPSTSEPSADREALIALYHATGGPQWTNNENWLTNRPLGEWHGIITDGNGRVVELELSENNLTGIFPPELGQLSNLTEL